MLLEIVIVASPVLPVGASGLLGFGVGLGAVDVRLSPHAATVNANAAMRKRLVTCIGSPTSESDIVAGCHIPVLVVRVERHFATMHQDTL